MKKISDYFAATKAFVAAHPTEIVIALFVLALIAIIR